MTDLDLDALEASARAQAAAYSEMEELDGGFRMRGIVQPSMFEDLTAWSRATENEHADTVLALIARVREAEARIEKALGVARSGSVPLGVSEDRHYDRLLAEVRRALTTDTNTEGANSE